MCNNNGHCRKFDAGAMCPSYRVTRDERDVTRGRANALRLALSGQLGSEGLTSEAMRQTMSLCVSCKACRRECPTGVDMAAMKIEFLHQYHKLKKRPLKDDLVAHLPRRARRLSRLAGVLSLRERVPGIATLTERITGISAKRRLPGWHREPFAGQSEVRQTGSGPEVVLFVDTFNRWFEPGIVRDAVGVLCAAGYRVIVPEAADGGHPLCCGRTFLATGMIDEAREEMGRTLGVLKPYMEREVPVVGLEPSCTLGMHDEFLRVLPGRDSEALGELAMTFEEFLARESGRGRLNLRFGPPAFTNLLVHGHCHQKAFGIMPGMETALALLPDVNVRTVPGGCCGMAGAFGYDTDNYDVSRKMAEAELLPALRRASEDTVVVANGTSCRHQISDLSDRHAVHIASLMARCAEQ